MIRDFSKDWYGPALEEINTRIFEKVCKYTDYDNYIKAYNKGLLDKELREIESITFKRFGLRIHVVEGNPMDTTGGGLTYFIQRMSHNLYSSISAFADNRDPKAVYEEAISNRVKDFFKKNIGKKGYVDEVNLKVSGIFSEYVTDMGYNFWFAINRLKTTPYNLTGFMLHETRHVFQSFMWSHKIDRVGILMQELSVSLKNSEPAKKREYILTNLEEMSLLERKEVEKLAKEERAIVIGGTLFVEIYRKFFHQNGYYFQASHSAEDDADSFAVMFGYGNAIPQHFKLYEDITRNAFRGVMFQGISLVLSMFILLTMALSPILFLIAGAIAIVSGVKFLSAVLLSFKDGLMWSVYLHNYDDNINRVERFNRDLISRLKDFNIDKEIKKSILDQIAINDRLLNSSTKTNTWSNITQWLGYKIIGIFEFFDVLGHKGQLDKLEESRNMEKLAFNNLFVASAKLDVSKESYKRLSLEFIDFQLNDPFCNELDSIHKQMREVVMPLNSEREYQALVTKGVFYELDTKLEKLVHDRLGIGISLNHEMGLGPCCIPYVIRFGTVTQTREGEDWLMSSDSKSRDFAIDNKMSETTVDFKHAKISGAMSKYNHYVNIDYFEVFRICRCSPREVSAILMHEIMHLFTAISEGIRIDKTNQTLSAIANSIKNNESAGQRKYLLIDLEEIGSIEKEDVTRLAKEERPMILSAKLYGAIYKKYYNTAISLEYTDHTGETLADTFASRFGYGKDLVIGLSKITKFYDDKSFWRTIKSYRKFLFILLVGCIFVPPLAVLGLAITGISLLASLMGLFISKLFYRDGLTYDDLYNRLSRIKRDMIQILKKSNIDPDLRKNTLASIKKMDDIVAKWKDKDDQDYDILTRAIMVFSSDRRKIEEEIRIERMLEELSSNKLFVASAQLQDIE